MTFKNSRSPASIVALPIDVLTQLQKHSGPIEGTKEHEVLQEKMGLTYRTLLWTYPRITTDVLTGSTHFQQSTSGDTNLNER